MAFGTHFSDTWGLRTFSQTATPLGVAIPIYTATSVDGGLPIYNPTGSGVVIELVKYDVNFASTLDVFGAIVLMAGAVGSIGTGTGCSVMNNIVPINNGTCLQTGGSRVQSSNGSGTTTVTAGVATPPKPGVPGAGPICSLYNFNLENNAGTAHATGIDSYWFNGTIAVPEGVIIYLAATQATGGLYCSGVTWKEYPKSAVR